MHHLRFEHVDVFVQDVEDQLVDLGLGRVVYVGPFRTADRAQFLVTRQQIVTVRERRNFGDDFDVLGVGVPHQIGHFVLLENFTVCGVVVRRVLIGPVLPER